MSGAAPSAAEVHRNERARRRAAFTRDTRAGAEKATVPGGSLQLFAWNFSPRLAFSTSMAAGVNRFPSDDAKRALPQVGSTWLGPAM